MRAQRAALAALAALALASGCGSTPTAGCGECGPTVVAVGEGAVWAAQGRTLSRFDPRSGELERRVDVLPQRHGGDIQAIALHGGDAWVGWSEAVAGVRPSGAIAFREPRRPRGHVVGMATVGGRTWLATGQPAIALAGDGSICLRPRLRAPAAGLAAGDGIVWVVGGRTRWAKVVHKGWTPAPAGPGYAVALDAASGRRVGEMETPRGPSAVAVWRDRLWVASAGGLDQLEVTTGRRRHHLEPGQGRIAVGEGSLWMLTYDGVLSRLDPDDGALVGAPLSLGQEAWSLTTGDGAVWVGLRNPGIMRIDASTMRVSWRRSIPVT